MSELDTAPAEGPEAADVALQEQPVSLCFCIDEIMAMPLSVTLASILDHRAPSTRIEVHVVGMGLSAVSRQRIEATVRGRAALAWYDLSGEVKRTLDRLFLNSGNSYPPSSYARILAGSYLPERLGRVIYLDADVVATTDLRPLWETDLEGGVLAATPEIVPEHRSPQLAAMLTPADRRRFGCDGTAPYFSSGVMVMDLDRLRAGVEAELLDVIRRYPGFDFPDQDALNVVASRRYSRLDPRWNQTPTAYFEEAGPWSGLSGAEIETLRRAPWIIHFASRPKPWMAGCAHPLLSAWQEAFRRTPWAQEPRPRLRRAAEVALRARRVLRKKLTRALGVARKA